MKVIKFEEGQVEFENKVLFDEMAKDTNDVLKKYNEKFEQEILVRVDKNTQVEQNVDIEVQKGNEVNGAESVSDEHFTQDEIYMLDRVIREETEADVSYLEKAKLVESEAIADMFKCIAKEEIQHKVLLENLKNGEFYTRETPIKVRTVVIEPQDVSENDKMYIELLMEEEQDAMKSYLEAGQLAKSQILQENFVEIHNDEQEHFARLGRALHGEIEVEDAASELVEQIEDGIKVDVINKHYTEESKKDLDNDVNFSQEQKESINLENALDEIININKEKGEGEDMAIKKELEEKVAVEEEVKVNPENFEAQEKKEDIKEETTEKDEAKKVEEEENKEDSETEKVEEACIDNCKNMEADEDDDKEDDDKDDKEDVKEEAEVEMSKADRKTFEARIATLEQNLKAVKAELKVAEPYKALYEAEAKKVEDLEAYKEDVELDRLRTNKVDYAKTCNFNALEDEDKEVVQEKIDDYKFSLYDFKAFMADVLKKYSKKQVYANMDKIISYFSVNEGKNPVEDVAMPSDKNMSDRILDKYSDVL